MIQCNRKNIFGILLFFWILLKYEWIKICNWIQLIIENFNQHSQKTKLKDYLKQIKINNNNWIHQCCQIYIIIYFQNTVYKFGLNIF